MVWISMCIAARWSPSSALREAARRLCCDASTRCETYDEGSIKLDGVEVGFYDEARQARGAGAERELSGHPRRDRNGIPDVLFVSASDRGRKRHARTAQGARPLEGRGP